MSKEEANKVEQQKKWTEGGSGEFHRKMVEETRGKKKMEDLSETIGDAKGRMEETVLGGIDKVKGGARNVGEKISSGVGGMKEGAESMLYRGVNSGVEAVRSAKNFTGKTVENVKNYGSEIKGAGSRAWESIVGIKDRMVKGAKEAKDGLFARLGSAKNKAIDKATNLKNRGAKFGFDAATMAKNKINKASEAVNNSYEGVKGGAKRAYEGAKETYTGAKEGVKEAYKGAERLYRENKLSGLLEEIQEKQKQADYLKKQLGVS